MIFSWDKSINSALIFFHSGFYGKWKISWWKCIWFFYKETWRIWQCLNRLWEGKSKSQFRFEIILVLIILLGWKWRYLSWKVIQLFITLYKMLLTLFLPASPVYKTGIKTYYYNNKYCTIILTWKAIFLIIQTTFIFDVRRKYFRGTLHRFS